MAFLHSTYSIRDYKWGHEKKKPHSIQRFLNGWEQLQTHPIFPKLYGDIYPKKKHLNDQHSAACVQSNGNIYVNVECSLNADEWAYTIAHCLLHLALGHFDKEKMPSDLFDSPDQERSLALWNKSCDIYITRFLIDIKMGVPTGPDPSKIYPIKLTDEIKIYEYLNNNADDGSLQEYGTSSIHSLDMIGLDHPLSYARNESNEFAERFSYIITHLASKTVSNAGGHVYDNDRNTSAMQAARWFINHYPLLGSMAASFTIIEDTDYCIRSEIEIAAIDAVRGEIYVNPTCGFSEAEWRFVLAHEFLHAGLMHHKRCQGRDAYIWNVACDYVINGWLKEMQIGEMPPKGLLYDESLKGMSAEAIYDFICKDTRRQYKLPTFRGYKKGDILGNGIPAFHEADLRKGIRLDEFFRNSLRESLDYHLERSRGFLPAGLIEEIYALSMPVIPWDVELGHWFDQYFPTLEKHRTYARPSRRQSSTPDIPRPRTVLQDIDETSRTFGVVIDTSGSVSSRELAMALGSIASYASAKEVPFARVVFCDANAYDAGYISPEDISGKIQIRGRGGTILQPAIHLLEKAKDFPGDAPILIITDGEIESNLRVHRDHAFLLPKGQKLPFQAEGKVFYFQ